MVEEKLMVSVYCLTYNHEKYIKDALEGFVNQITDFRYEVYVHDDASTDRTAQIIREYAERYPNIIKPIFQEENQYSRGFSIFSTYVLPRLTGKYIAACEGDDYWCDNGKLQQQVDFLEAHADYSACVHNTVRIDMMTKKEELMYHHNGDDDISLEHVVNEGLSGFHLSSLLYRKEYAFNQPKFVNSVDGVGDYPFAIYLALVGKIRFINCPMSVYRCGTEGSWTVRVRDNPNAFSKILERQSEMLKMADEFSDRKYTELFQQAIIHNIYKGAYIRKDVLVLNTYPYKDIFRKEPLKNKFIFFCDKYIPWLHALYKRIKKFFKQRFL